MKAILFATNYSTASENAGDYAAQLAKLCHTQLIVLHSWTLPVFTPDDTAAVPPPKEFHERERREVEKEVMRLRAKWGVQVSGIETNGYTPDEIENLTREKDISLVIMGMHHHNYCGRLLGSVATVSLHKAGYPVLIVPDSISFTRPAKVLMAVDIEPGADEEALNVLKLFVRTMHASLELVNVESPEDLWTVTETPALIQLEHSLKYLEHNWNIEVNNSVTSGIQHAADKIAADWIAIAPRHFSWFEEIFRKGITHKLAYTTDRPLLILPAVSASSERNKINNHKKTAV